VIAFIASLLATVAMVGIVVAVGQRRPPGTPITWGEGFAAATFVFFLLFMAYGVVPHQWLNWADNELNWRKDAFFFGESGLSLFGRGRILFPKEVLRDIVATVIYGVFLGAQIYGWLWWQNRGRKRAEPPELVSPYGRPLLRLMKRT
jgi:nicotinamide riboside transporter PnuC